MTSSFPAAPLTSCSSRLSPDFSRTRVPCAPGPLRPNWAPARGSWPRLPVDRTVPLQVRSFTYPRAALVPGSEGRDHLWLVPCREPRARHAVGPQLRVWLREGTGSHHLHASCLGSRPAGSPRGTPPAPAARTAAVVFAPGWRRPRLEPPRRAMAASWHRGKGAPLHSRPDRASAQASSVSLATKTPAGHAVRLWTGSAAAIVTRSDGSSGAGRAGSAVAVGRHDRPASSSSRPRAVRCRKTFAPPP